MDEINLSINLEGLHATSTKCASFVTFQYCWRIPCMRSRCLAPSRGRHACRLVASRGCSCHLNFDGMAWHFFPRIYFYELRVLVSRRCSSFTHRGVPPLACRAPMRHFGEAQVPVAWRKLPSSWSGNAHLSTKYHSPAFRALPVLQSPFPSITYFASGKLIEAVA
jgi:hypothetical protein